MEVLIFLEKFLDRVSPRVKGWEKTYAIDIRVSSEVSTAKCVGIVKVSLSTTMF